MFYLEEVILSLAAFSLAYLIVAIIRRNGQKKNDKRRPPSIPALPLVGSLPFIGGSIDDLPQFFMKKAETLGSVFHFYIGSKLAVVLNDRNSIFDAYVKHSEAFSDRDEYWTELNVANVNLKGISASHYNDIFKRSHKIILSVLKEFGYGAVRETEVRICEEVEVMLRAIRNRNGQPFNPDFDFSMVSGNIMMKILFGRNSAQFINCGEIMETAHVWMKNSDPKLNVAPIIRFLPEYRKVIDSLSKATAKLMLFLEEGIKHSQSGETDNNFVKRYLEIEGSDYDHENLLYIVRDLMLGSVDTVSGSLQWALIELANHRDVQDRLLEEIDELIPDDRLPSLDDKPNLPYTEAVIMESMRLHTLAPLSVPRSTSKDTEAGGYYIPRGCVVIPNLYAAHMNRKVWIDPENFRPERFLDKENNVIGKEMVIPFSLGKRSCIGEVLARHQLFLLLTSVVQQFDIRPPEGQESITAKEEFFLTVRPASYEIRLIPRRKKT